jgi:preprotein translocase subunit SecA
MALEGVAAVFGAVFQKLFGSRNERLVKAYRQVAVTIGDWERQFAALSDEELAAKTPEFRRRIAAGETLDDILPEAFAVVRIAADRAIGLRPFDVQLVGGQVLCQGCISEMVTGEGKTLVAVLPNYLRALFGKVHLVTVNDYLVRRDAQWMGPIFKRLGLTVGFIQTPMDSAQRIPEYNCDITYGTNNEFGFDYLRDNMKTSRAEQVQGPLNFVIVDEVDSVLIDEARTPLIISGPAFESTRKFAEADQAARKLRRPRQANVADSDPNRDPDADFTIMEKERSCTLTERGQQKALRLVGVATVAEFQDAGWDHLITQALRAHHIYRLDKEYVVKDDEVIIVDEFTGRLMPGRQWSDGLHQAVEAKEGITIKEETQTLATITFQNFFKLYDHLAGMTGTAMTEAEEFYKIYKLDVVAIPTNRPLNRVSHPDVVYLTLKEKQKATIDEIAEYSARGRPVLVGTVAIETSERLSNLLMSSHGVEHEVLSAKYHEKEADIVAKAGQRHEDRRGTQCGNVTIATNMAGRGTDIKMGPGVVYEMCRGPWVVGRESRPDDIGNKCCINCHEYDGTCAHCFKPKRDPAFPQRGRTECPKDPPCGLHIVGTERHESRRIDNQLRGRSGRQGDPGSSRFFLSLEDDLMRIFAKDWVTNILRRLGMEEGMALEHGFLSRGIENAQKKVEEHNFHIRKNLLEYDEVMDSQRKVFYGRRQEILESDNLRPLVWDTLLESVDKMLENVLRDEYAAESVAEWARRTLSVNVTPGSLQGRTAEDMEIYLKDRATDESRSRISESIGEFVIEPEYADNDAEDDEGPEGVEREPAAGAAGPEIDYRALAAWARSYVGVELNERELRQMELDDIEEKLHEAAAKRIEATDCSALRGFLDESYPRRVICEWFRQKFDLRVNVEDLAGHEADLREWILGQLSTLYDRREREYPIEYAVDRYLNPRVTGGTFDYEGLANWATWHYAVKVEPAELQLDTVDDVQRKLLEVSAESERTEALPGAVHRGLVRFLADESQTLSEHNLPMVRQWAAEALGVEMPPAELAGRPRRDLEQMLLSRAIAARRNQVNSLERYLLLQVYDTTWKDHLYMMDHLKQDVGLRGYAQKDPKLEYKREGLELFEQMLGGIADKFTGIFFKARWVQREALNRIWSGQSATHEEATSVMSQFDQQRQAAMQSLKQQTLEKPKPIVRSTQRVGRNDPCPCGSGKKYKKCCGQNS